MTRLTRCAGWAVITVVAVAAIAVVGCGGGGDPAPPANTGSITGTVLYAATGLPLGDIDIVAGGVATTTNANGQFVLNNVPEGAQVVVVTAAPARDLIAWGPPIVVQVVAGQNTALPAPVLMIDGNDGPPVPPA